MNQATGGFMVRCQAVEKLANQYLDRELTALRRTQVEKHLTECESCRSLIADLEAIILTARSLPQPRVPNQVRERLRSFLRKEVGFNPKPHLRIAK